MVIIVFGLPGSGKSYFASHLAKRLKTLYVNSDVLRKELIAKRTYSIDEKRAVYQAMLESMIRAIREKQSIVLDATFFKKSIREEFTAQAQAQGEHIIFIEVIAAEPLIKKRLSQPRPDSEADFSIYQKIEQEYEPLSAPHLVLQSGTNNINSMLTEALNYLDHRHEK